MSRIIVCLSLFFCVVALLFKLEYTASSMKTGLRQFLSLSTFSFFHTKSSDSPIKVFSKTELLEYKGHNRGKVYLAIVGSVFDVTRGKRHYGPGGGYEFFSGIDGSKGYVTGKFDEEGLIDDISELTPAEVIALENWRSFYERDYTYMGKVVGAFYDKNGQELEMMRFYRKQLKAGEQEKELLEKDRTLFPPCNSEWSQDRGGRVWCSEQSGGVKRDWIGVPRRYFAGGSSKPRCACVRTTGPTSYDLTSKNHKDIGDLDNPNLNLYPNCHKFADSCLLSN